MIRTLTAGLALATFIGLATPSAADAQQTRWQVTASLVTGGFPTDLASEPFTAGLRFEGVGGIDPKQVFPVDFNQAADDDASYSFDSFTGFGATAEWRRDRLGVFGSLSYVPTRAVAVTNDLIPTQAARAFGFQPVNQGDEETEVQIRLKTSQDLLIPMLGVNLYSAALPEPGRPPEPYEFYGTLGVGIVSYRGQEPIGLARTDPQDWDTPVLFNVGGGLFVNFTSAVGLRVDLKGSFWKTEINDESHTQAMIAFSPGFVFIL